MTTRGGRAGVHHLSLLLRPAHPSERGAYAKAKFALVVAIISAARGRIVAVAVAPMLAAHVAVGSVVVA